MKDVASSIIILSAVLMLISAEHFDNLMFWIIGVIMLVDGFILFTASILFPKKLSNWLKSSKRIDSL